MRRFRWCGILALLLALLLTLSGCSDVMKMAGSLSQALQEDLQAAETEAPRAEATATPRTTKAKNTAAPRAAKAKATATPKAARAAEGPITEPQAIADYLFEHGELPDNFITKKEAQELGWINGRNYVSDVAPGKSIGGDRFGNYEGKLPRVKGRTYYEADCYYRKGKRTKERIVYSSDGHVWYSDDHYNTFTELFPGEP